MLFDSWASGAVVETDKDSAAIQQSRDSHDHDVHMYYSLLVPIIDLDNICVSSTCHTAILPHSNGGRSAPSLIMHTHGTTHGGHLSSVSTVLYVKLLQYHCI